MSSPNQPNYRRFEPKNIPSSNGVKLPPLNFSNIQQTNKPIPSSYSSLPFSPSKTRSIYRVDNVHSSPPNSPPPLRRGVASPVHCLRPIPIRGFREFVATSSDSSSSASDSSSNPTPSPTPTPNAVAAADDAKPKKYWDIIAAIATASTYGYEP